MEQQATYKKNGHRPTQYPEGQVPPQALQLEEAVLGALMIDRESILSVADLLTPEAFYSPANQLVYRAILSLFAESRPVDTLTVAEALRRSGDLERIGGSVYLADLTNGVASSANVEYHARIIAQKHLRRRVIEACQRAQATAFDPVTGDVEALENAERELFEAWGNYASGTTVQLHGPAIEAFQAAERARQSNGLVGIPSGIGSIDQLTGGFQDTDLIIIAARPSMGKTGLAMNIAYNAAKQYNIPVAVFSLEMSKVQLAQRIISAETMLDSHRIRQGQTTDSDLLKIRQCAEEMAGVPLFIDDTPGITLMKLRAAARRLKIRNSIRLIVIDYLQLMSGGGERGKNREQEIAEISRGLKILAKELGLPVIVLSQLSRAVEVRGGAKRPMLSDLRESGAIEQDADVVAFLYRPEYYGIMEDENGNSTKGRAEVIFAKHRNGKVGTVLAAWDENTTTFRDIEKPPFSAAPNDYSMPRHEPATMNDETPF